MKRLISNTYPYHISGQCNDNDWHSLNLNVVWKIFEKHLHRMKKRDGVLIHHFILMNNHYHMIISTPKSNLSHAMCNLHRDISREINYFANRQGHLLKRRYYSCVLEKYFYYLIVLKFIYSNSVRSQICNKVEDYHFSSVIHNFSFNELSHYDLELSLFKDKLNTLDWLNEPLDQQLEFIIKKSLKKRNFKIPSKYQSTAHTLILEGIRKSKIT